MTGNFQPPPRLALCVLSVIWLIAALWFGVNFVLAGKIFSAVIMAVMDPGIPWAGFVLVGGSSSRMGQDKAMLQFQDHSLLPAGQFTAGTTKSGA